VATGWISPLLGATSSNSVLQFELKGSPSAPFKVPGVDKQVASSLMDRVPRFRCWGELYEICSVGKGFPLGAALEFHRVTVKPLMHGQSIKFDPRKGEKRSQRP
jgi:hypothetical protein